MTRNKALEILEDAIKELTSIARLGDPVAEGKRVHTIKLMKFIAIVPDLELDNVCEQWGVGR